jgi:hypothetical protein
VGNEVVTQTGRVFDYQRDARAKGPEGPCVDCSTPITVRHAWFKVRGGRVHVNCEGAANIEAREAGSRGE